MWRSITSLLLLLWMGQSTLAIAPRDALPLDAPSLPRDFRLHVRLGGDGGGVARLAGGVAVKLVGGGGHDVAVEHPKSGAPVLRVWSGGVLARGPEEMPELSVTGADDGRPVVEVEAGATVEEAWIQPLEAVDHGELVRGWNDRTLAEGRRIYSTLCVVCHGTRDLPGSLPTALRFGEGVFKNGSDPYSMYSTLAKGYGQMVPQGQYTTAQKYAVIHYIRETFLKNGNPSQFPTVTPAYLETLPKGRSRSPGEKEDRSLPPYQRMDFGPALSWTFEVAPGNIAQKGIAVRLDEGPGGVGAGNAWMVYDHDTLRVATATTGTFVDWRGIAFDGSHGTHTRLTGNPHFVNPVGPGWASPDGSWLDPRPLGTDGKPYGPLPRSWARHRGLYLNGGRVVLASEVNGIGVLESPGWLPYGTTPVFLRTVNVGDGSAPLRLRVAPDSVQALIMGGGRIRRDAGFWVAELPPGCQARIFISRADEAALAALAATVVEPLDLQSWITGGSRRWPEEIVTASVAGDDRGAFVSDDFPLPEGNPWGSWMRPGGFDFTTDGRAAAVATWNGDVWRVEGLMDPAPAPLRWRRVATGLFQPLGVKFRGDDLFVLCRDQLARLRDLNGDGETDFIECFNNDHQVTEHFHEFAMGLQIDAAGNFYYAKSGRHALKAVVPHHGTLLKILADGSATEILATGFRAANGVGLDEDGTFWVTDQEGFWTPKNRINRVRTGGFYGNLFGYTDVTDTSDAAMEPPLVWITNEKDRSPAELVRVPKGSWGTFGGALLNLSYGTGRAFVVPNESVDGVWQGAVCELPMPAFATGIMRGRFGPDGALYTCGMFAWAGNATAPGGFHRIRRTERAAHVPLEVHAVKGGMILRFSEDLDAASVRPGAFALKVWALKRSANYGSPHVDEHVVPVETASLDGDRRTVRLRASGLVVTPCYALGMTLRGSDGTVVERSIHGTIHRMR